MSDKALTDSYDERFTTAIRCHVFDRIPLSRALREAGFSPSYSRRGKNDLMKASKPFAASWRFIEAEQRARRFEGHSKDSSPANVAGEPDVLKNAVKRRLVKNIEEGRDEGVRSAQLLGKFKEHDWWVRNEDAPVGVFVALSTRKEAITAQAKAIDSYED
jgi:hypothetical protein